MVKPKLWFSNRNSFSTCSAFLPQSWTYKDCLVFTPFSPLLFPLRGIHLPLLPPSLSYVIFSPSAYKITEHFENMILFPFPGQHFSVYNKKASKAGVWWGESWGLHRSPGGCQWPDPAPALLSLCSSRWNHHLLKYSEFLGAVPGCSPARAKDVHGQTRELAGPVSGGFAPLHLLKMLQNEDLGVH